MKQLFFKLTILFCSFSYSQIGIGPSEPHSSAALDITTTDKAFLLPRVANTASITSPVNGMMIYDTSANCMKFYENGAWISYVAANSSNAAAANCNLNGFQGLFVSEAALDTSNKYSVTITNNSLSSVTIAFATTDLVLSGVSGMSVASVSHATATIISGASQLIEYTLSGTPTSSGTLTGTWNKLSLNCVKTATVLAPYISTLNCTPTDNGTINSGVTISGGVNSVFSYTGGNNTAYSGQAVNSTGVTGLTATLSSGTFANGTGGTLTYTITGTPSGGGTASFAIEIGGKSCTLTRTVIPVGSITSINCAGATNNGTLTSGTEASGVSSVINYTNGNGGIHNGQTVPSTGVTGLTATLSSGTFANGTGGTLTYTITGMPSGAGTASFAINIGGQTCNLTRTVVAGPVYCTGSPTTVVDVTSPYTGKVWMDRNLGATQAATSATDTNSYGDLYQYGRGNDGHQCRNSGTTSDVSSTNQPLHGSFITNSSNWRSITTPVWQGLSGENNPCPSGYRVPTYGELIDEKNGWVTASLSAFASFLKIPSAGIRIWNGNLALVESTGLLGSNLDAGYQNIRTDSVTGSYAQSYGHSIRCIKGN